MHLVLYRCIAMAIEVGSKVGTCCIIVVLIGRPGCRRGNTERVIARWGRPVASSEALVMLHRAMRSVLHRRTAMSIEMAHDGGEFVRRCRLFRLL
jgi:hypothetical protein